MKMSAIRGVSSLTVLLMGGQFAFGATENKPENRGQLSEKDYKFACEAAKGGMMEVKAGELAKTKSADPNLKQFGEKMVADHSKAGDELKEIAARKGATLPTELDTDQQRFINKLQNLTGKDFDKAYADEMVDDHKKDLKEFQKAAEKTEDADLKNFAAKTVTVIAQHLEHAQHMSANVSRR
jgi:putative membrane protein